MPGIRVLDIYFEINYCHFSSPETAVVQRVQTVTAGPLPFTIYHGGVPFGSHDTSPSPNAPTFDWNGRPAGRFFSPVHTRSSRENVFFRRKPRPLCCPCCHDRFPALPGSLARALPILPLCPWAFNRCLRADSRPRYGSDRPSHRLSYFSRMRRNFVLDVFATFYETPYKPDHFVKRLGSPCGPSLGNVFWGGVSREIRSHDIVPIFPRFRDNWTNRKNHSSSLES